MAFDYRKYKTEFSVEDIDTLFKQGTFNAILKLITAYYWLRARRLAIEYEMLIQKQEHEKDIHKKNKTEIEDEPMDNL
jgi:hypothetical protein